MHSFQQNFCQFKAFASTKRPSIQCIRFKKTCQFNAFVSTILPSIQCIRFNKTSANSKHLLQQNIRQFNASVSRKLVNSMHSFQQYFHQFNAFVSTKLPSIQCIRFNKTSANSMHHSNCQKHPSQRPSPYNHCIGVFT